MYIRNINDWKLIVRIFFIILIVYTLQCWKCSSDIDVTCNDHFNGSQIFTNRFSNTYDNQNSNQRQSYDPNYDPNYNQNYNRNYLNRQNPTLENCDDNEANIRRKKNVCIKKVIKGTNYQSVIRRCHMIDFNEAIGTCHDPVNRGLSLEFCEYCDYDGCNSATNIKSDLVLTLGFISIILTFRQKIVDLW